MASCGALPSPSCNRGMLSTGSRASSLWLPAPCGRTPRHGAWALSATPKDQPSKSGQASRARKMEADLDAVMMRFKGLGQPKRKPEPEPAPAPPQPSSSTQSAPAAARQGKKQTPQQPQQQRKGKLSPEAGAAKQRTPAPKAAVAKPQLEDDDDDGDLNMERLWREVDTAVKQRSSTSRRDEDAEEVLAAPPPVASTRSSPAPSKASSSSSSPRGFKGFGPSPAEIQAGIKAADAAVSKGKGPKQILRVFLYSLDEAGARQAIIDAGLEGQVVLEQDVKQCVAVLSAKEGKAGKRVHFMQGERMASNAGIPFICVGRRMTGPNLRAAVMPLFSNKAGSWKPEPDLRETARAAVRAAKRSGFFAPPVQPAADSQAQGSSGSGATSSSSQATASAGTASAISTLPGSTEAAHSADGGSAGEDLTDGHEDEQGLDSDLHLLLDSLKMNRELSEAGTGEQEEEEERQLVGSASGPATRPARRVAMRPRTGAPRLRLASRAQ